MKPTLSVHLPLTQSLLGWSASHFYTNQTLSLNFVIDAQHKIQKLPFLFFCTLSRGMKLLLLCHLRLERSCSTILNGGLTNEVMQSPLPPSALLHLSLQDCKLLEFLFLAVQIPSCFLQCTAAKAAGRLVYSTTNQSVTTHSH